MIKTRHLLKVAVFSFVLLMFVAILSGCGAKYDGKTLEQKAEQALTDGFDYSSRAKTVAFCQAREVSKSGLPKHIADKILKANDPAVRARKFGYPELGKKLKRCWNKEFGKNK